MKTPQRPRSPPHPNTKPAYLSNSVSKPRILLENHLALVRLLVADLKVKSISHADTDDQQLHRDGSVHAGPVVGGVLRPEHQRAGDAADAAEADEGGGAEGAFPLAADVVGLVGHGGGDLGVDGAGEEEDAEVADCAAFGEALLVVSLV